MNILTLDDLYKSVEMFAKIAEEISLSFTSLQNTVDVELKPYATPRQWHLYKHGKRRVRKKWEAELWRRYWKAEREQRGAK